MCDADMIREYGILGGFDTVSNMLGEQLAVITDIYASDFDNIDDETEVDEYHGITFYELQQASLSIARQLKTRFGVKKSERVLIISSQTDASTAAEISAIFACLRVGAIFVPITINDKLQDIINSIDPIVAILVGQDDNSLIVKALNAAGLYRCCLLNIKGMPVEDDILSSLEPLSDESEDIVYLSHMSDAMYILHTSGSTGQSKGVVGTHTGLINRIAWQLETFPFDFGEVSLRRTPLTFVDSLVEILTPILSGRPICSFLMDRINSEGLASVSEIAETVGITRVTLIPSQLLIASKIDSLLGSKWPSLRLVFISGEECPKHLPASFAEVFPGARLINLYGSTEVAGDVTYSELCDNSRPCQVVAIGNAIDGNFIFGVEHHDNGDVAIVSEGSIGEIMVIGSHVAQGYYGNIVDNQQFISNPFISNAKLFSTLDIEDHIKAQILSHKHAYLTGDLASYSSKDGWIYHGRRDRVVKLRGLKVHLDDMERCLQAALEIETEMSVVVVAVNISDQMQSVGCVIDSSSLPDKMQGLSPTMIKLLLSKTSYSYSFQVPDIMLLTTESIPKTASLKVDRGSIKAKIENLVTEQSKEPPMSSLPNSRVTHSSQINFNGVLQTILSIYRSVLNGLHAEDNEVAKVDFYSLGGDSIRSLEVAWQVKEKFGISNFAIHLLNNSVQDLARIVFDMISCPLSPASAALSSANGEEESQSPPSKKHRVTTESREFTTESLSSVVWEGLLQKGSVRVGRDEPMELLPTQDKSSTDSILWNVALAKCVDASPVLCWGKSEEFSTEEASVSRHIIVIGSHGGDIKAVDAHTAETLWCVDIKEHIEAAVAIDISRALVFISSYQGSDVDGFQSRRPAFEDTTPNNALKLGAIRAVSLSSGQILWRCLLDGECKGTVAVDESAEIVYGACYQGTLYAISANDGAVIGSLMGLNGAVYASPVLGDDGDSLFVSTTRGSVYKVSSVKDKATGRGVDLQILWCYSSEYPSPVFSTPTLVSHDDCQILLVNSVDGTSRGIRADTGDMSWERQLTSAPIFSSPALSSLDGEVVLIIGAHDGKLRIIDAVTGENRLGFDSIDLSTIIFSSPFPISDKEIVVATTSGEIFQIEIKDKDSQSLIRRIARLPGEIFSSPVIFGDRLFVGCRDDNLYCIRLDYSDQCS